MLTISVFSFSIFQPVASYSVAATPVLTQHSCILMTATQKRKSKFTHACYFYFTVESFVLNSLLSPVPFLKLGVALSISECTVTGIFKTFPFPTLTGKILLPQFYLAIGSFLSPSCAEEQLRPKCHQVPNVLNRFSRDYRLC